MRIWFDQSYQWIEINNVKNEPHAAALAAEYNGRYTFYKDDFLDEGRVEIRVPLETALDAIEKKLGKQVALSLRESIIRLGPFETLEIPHEADHSGDFFDDFD